MIDVQHYKEKGYVLLRGFFTTEEIDLVREEARELFASQMLKYGLLGSGEYSEAGFERGMFALFETDLQAFINCGKQAQHLISLHRLAVDQRMVAVLNELGLEFPNISTRPVMYFNSPKLATKEVYWRLSLHQDWRSIQGSLDSVVVWVPLMKIDKSVGALEVIPGSHLRGLLKADLIDGYGHINETIETGNLISIEIEKGDALFFSTFLVHQSGTNVTESIRWSCHFRYNNLREESFIERGLPHPYIYRPQEELITEGFPSPSQVGELFR